MSAEEWRSAVRVQEAPDLARHVLDRLPAPEEPRAVRVTDLVALRRGYWRAVAPVPIEGDRLERVEAGRRWHRRLGPALAREGALEVRVRRDGCVGRIDVLGDLPTEVKTGAQAVPAEELVASRPDQVEQLAMYCALTEREAGRLVVFTGTGDSEGRAQVVDFEFHGVAPLRAWMCRRSRDLRTAWSEHRTDGLPACRWFDRGCEYRAAGVCDCREDDPPAADPIASLVVGVRPRPDLATRLEEDVRARPVPSGPVVLGRFRNLLYPRRVYFERTRREPEPPLPARDPLEPLDRYEQIAAAVEGGPVGEVALVPSAVDEPDEEVVGFRGAPFLVKVSRARDPPTAEELLAHQPQYGLELGARCVATGTSSALLFLGRERARDERDRLHVFRLEFGPMSPFSRWWLERRTALDRALTRGDPFLAPACPSWMYADCPYRADCGCAAVSPRSQR